MSSYAHLSQLNTYATTSNARLKSLYSEFAPQKHSNPTSYASNIEWWRRTLEAITLHAWQPQFHAQHSSQDKLILHAEGITFSEGFRYEGVGRPLSLATVIAELCNSKAYFPLSDFLNSSKSIYDPGWLPYRIVSYVVGKPFWWALQQLNIVDEDSVGGSASESDRWKRVKGKYVVVSLLEKAAQNVIRIQSGKGGVSLADSLYNTESFKTEFASVALDGVVLSDTDIRVLIKYLARDKGVLLVQGDVMKFVLMEGTHSGEITAVDGGILELKTAVGKLHLQVDRLQHSIEERTVQISTALRQKRKAVALTHLRARKQLEDLLTKRLGSLEMLQSTLFRVEASADDIEILKSYESSTATLRAILAHPSLQRDKVDETMDAMASANADAKEIDDAVRMGADIAQADSNIDESELDEELRALVKEVEIEEARKTQAEQDRVQAERDRQTLEQLASSTLKAPHGVPAMPEQASLVH